MGDQRSPKRRRERLRSCTAGTDRGNRYFETVKSSAFTEYHRCDRQGGYVPDRNGLYRRKGARLLAEKRRRAAAGTGCGMGETDL